MVEDMPEWKAMLYRNFIDKRKVHYLSYVSEKYISKINSIISDVKTNLSGKVVQYFDKYAELYKRFEAFAQQELEEIQATQRLYDLMCDYDIDTSVFENGRSNNFDSRKIHGLKSKISNRINDLEEKISHDKSDEEDVKKTQILQEMNNLQNGSVDVKELQQKLANFQNELQKTTKSDKLLDELKSIKDVFSNIYAFKSIDYNLKSQLKDLLPSFLFALHEYEKNDLTGIATGAMLNAFKNVFYPKKSYIHIDLENQEMNLPFFCLAADGFIFQNINVKGDSAFNGVLNCKFEKCRVEGDYAFSGVKNSHFQSMHVEGMECFKETSDLTVELEKVGERFFRNSAGIVLKTKVLDPSCFQYTKSSKEEKPNIIFVEKKTSILKWIEANSLKILPRHFTAFYVPGYHMAELVEGKDLKDYKRSGVFPGFWYARLDGGDVYYFKKDGVVNETTKKVCEYKSDDFINDKEVQKVMRAALMLLIEVPFIEREFAKASSLVESLAKPLGFKDAKDFIKKHFFLYESTKLVEYFYDHWKQRIDDNIDVLIKKRLFDKMKFFEENDIPSSYDFFLLDDDMLKQMKELNPDNIELDKDNLLKQVKELNPDEDDKKLKKQAEKLMEENLEKAVDIAVDDILFYLNHAI